MGQVSLKYLSDEKDRTHLCSLLSVGSSLLAGQHMQSLGHTMAVVAVLSLKKVMRWHGKTKNGHKKTGFNSSSALWNRLLLLCMETQVEKLA